MRSFVLAIVATFAFACAAPPIVEAQHSAEASAASAASCSSERTVKALSSDWDREFQHPSIATIRQLGGLYLSLRADAFEQSRSLDGPTFRVRCDGAFRGRLLQGIPPLEGSATYAEVLVAFVDYVQVPLVMNGERSLRHRLTLQRGKEEIVEFATPSLSAGIHRLSILAFDDVQTLGLFGWHDLQADLYVGSDPTLAQPKAKELPTRAEPAVESGDYGIPLSRSADGIQLAGNIQWSPSTKLYAALFGSAGDGKALVAVALLQDCVQIPLPQRYYWTLPGRVTNIDVVPKEPSNSVESLTAIVFTRPGFEIAAQGHADRAHTPFALASQKVYLRR